MTKTSNRRISLTIGPVLFNWPTRKWQDFYARIADEAPVDSVHIGEVVCSKRLPFYLDAIAGAAERLQRCGKKVVLSSLALITLPRERRDTADLVRDAEYEVEVNDVTALAYLEQDQAFRIGPYMNVYNESTLQTLVKLGASSVCLPPELPMDALTIVAAAAKSWNIDCEVWSFGRIPLAISGRCYHARIDGLTKDSCQFVCSRDSDGLDVDTLDGTHFLAINGVQTLSHTYCNMIGNVDSLEKAGVTALRLSPHSCDMVEISRIFRGCLDGRLDTQEATNRIRDTCGGASFSNGFLFGDSGSDIVEYARD